MARRTSARTSSSTRLVAVVVSLVAALAAAGCSSSSSAGQSQSGPQALTLTASSGPISLDPARSNSADGEVFVDLAYDSLIHATSDGKYEPALAERWEYVGSGNKEFRLTLRKGLQFADGTPLNAAAVKASMDYFKSAQGPFAATMGIISSIETPDTRTVVVHLKTPNPDLPFDFAEGGLWGAIVSAKGIANPKALGTSTAGAGPYVLDSTKSVANSKYVYKPNPHFSDKARQKWSSVTVNIVADANSALQTVTSGQSDWMAATQDQVAAAKGAGLTVENAVPSVMLLFLQDRAGKLVPALGSEKVRQAMNYAVDRDSIAKVLDGQPNEQIVSSNRTGYSTSAESTYSFDLTKAKDLLKQAGYADGFSMKVLVGAYAPSEVKTTQIVAAQLAKIGVKIDIVTAPTFPDYARQQESGKFPATLTTWPATTMFTVGQQLVLPDGVVNPFKSSDGELNSLFAKAAGEAEEQAAGTWQQFSTAVTQKAWFVPVATVTLPFAGSKNIPHPAGDGFTFANPLYFR